MCMCGSKLHAAAAQESDQIFKAFSVSGSVITRCLLKVYGQICYVLITIPFSAAIDQWLPDMCSICKFPLLFN